MGANCSIESALYFDGDTNLTNYVLDEMGEPCLDDEYIALTLAIYSTVFVMGVFGNICTIIVIWLNKSLHSVTNYYLFSLSVSDLLCLILGLPLEFHASLTQLYPYQLPWIVCKARGFVSESTSYASVMTVFVFAVERWIAICYPLKLQTFSRTSRVIKTLLVIWGLAFIFASPLSYYLVVVRLEAPENYADTAAYLLPNGDIPGTEICTMRKNSETAQLVLIHTSFWLFFTIPFSIMLGLFFHIVVVMNRTRKAGVFHGLEMLKLGSSVNREAAKAHNSSRRMVTWMLFTVVGIFFICWLPFHLQRLMILHNSVMENKSLAPLIDLIYFISGYFYYANSSINPILYNAFNSKFRNAFVSTILCCNPNPPSRTYPTDYRGEPRATNKLTQGLNWLKNYFCPSHHQKFSRGGDTSARSSNRLVTIGQSSRQNHSVTARNSSISVNTTRLSVNNSRCSPTTTTNLESTTTAKATTDKLTSTNQRSESFRMAKRCSSQSGSSSNSVSSLKHNKRSATTTPRRANKVTGYEAVPSESPQESRAQKVMLSENWTPSQKRSDSITSDTGGDNV